jgi:hypothetical protein
MRPGEDAPMSGRGSRPGPLAELDAVEIKLNFGTSQIEEAERVFGLDVAAGDPRRIWFGEDRDGRDGPAALPLSARGIILRVREKKRSDVTLKIRGPDGCIDVPAWKKRTGALGELAKVEGDWSGQRRLVSASLDRELDDEGRRELDRREPSVERLLSEEQRLLARELMIPRARVELLRPVHAVKWDADEHGGIAAELWTVSVDLRFLEVSIRVTTDPVGAMEDLTERAVAGGLRLEAPSDTKTRTVLRHLATSGS